MPDSVISFSLQRQIIHFSERNADWWKDYAILRDYYISSCCWEPLAAAYTPVMKLNILPCISSVRSVFLARRDVGCASKGIGSRFSSVRRLGGIKQRFAYTPQEGAVKIAQIGVLPCKHVLFCCGISGFKYLNIIYFLYKHFFVVIAAPFRMSCSLSFTRAGLSARETTSIVVHSLAKCLFTAVQSTMKCSTLLSRTASDADCWIMFLKALPYLRYIFKFI